ncbi:MAG: outer membrane lipoprotein-sorting protein [Desulfobulbaceae bacterium]|jgi:outer membrane lipoprotein-sorting protein|nr:outer membrane lipoprotein-sorting protein [Desulfobulbaceae bacterium]
MFFRSPLTGNHCVVAALCGFFCALVGHAAFAVALTGRDVAVKVDEADACTSSDMAIVMVIQRGGQTLERIMSVRKKKFTDMEKQRIRFLEPPDVRDTAYLTWSYKDFKKDDDMWVYLPAQSLTRRISGGGKKGAFMRGDYANEDMSRREVDEDAYTMLTDEKLAGVDCHVIEARPVFPDKTNYSKRVIWVRKDFWLPTKIDYYDQNETLMKELVFGGFKEIQGIWTATRQRMKTVDGDSETTLELRQVVYDAPVADDIFSSQDLKR